MNPLTARLIRSRNSRAVALAMPCLLSGALLLTYGAMTLADAVRGWLGLDKSTREEA